MDTENVKAIELKGIVHNETKIGIQDGQSEDLVNLRFKDSAWRASGDGKHVFSMQYQSDVPNTNGVTYQQIYIHTNIYRHVLGVRNNTLFWFANIDADGVFTALDTPVSLLSVSSDLYISQVGHLLTIIDYATNKATQANNFQYIIFKPADNIYKQLIVEENGSQTDRGIYPFGKIHFNYADAGEAGTITDDKTNQEGWDKWGRGTDWAKQGRVIELRGKNFGSLCGGGLDTLHNTMVEMYGKAREKNYFTDPFLVCAAIKLYDGKYMYASAPALIFPRQRAYDTESRMAHKEPTDQLIAGYDEIKSRGVYSHSGALLIPQAKGNARIGIPNVTVENLPGEVIQDTPIDLTDAIGTYSIDQTQWQNFNHARQGGDDVAGVFRNGISTSTLYTTGSYYVPVGDEYLRTKSCWKFQVKGCNLCVSIDSDLIRIMDDNKDIFQSLCIFITPQASVYKMDVEDKGYCRRTLDIAEGMAKIYYNGKGIDTPQFFRRSVANMSYMPNIREIDDIRYDLLHSPFYLLREYNQDELQGLLENPVVDLQAAEYNGILTNITQQNTLQVESVSRYSYLPKVQYTYNSRLHIANYTRTQFHGYPIDCFHLNNHSLIYDASGNNFEYFKMALYRLRSYCDDTLSEPRSTHYLNRYAGTQLKQAIAQTRDVSAYVETEIETANDGIQHVCRYIPYSALGDMLDFIETPDPLLSFPDSRATKMTIAILAQSMSGSQVILYKRTFELTKHPYLNIAYYFSEDLRPNKLDMIDTKSLTEYQTEAKPDFNPAPAESNTTEDYPNGLKVSSTNNPLYMPVESTYQVGSAEIVAIMSNAIAVGTGQTGAAPLYVFCKDGVYALLVDEKGEMAYTNARIIARDVCNNPKSVTPIDTGVVFTTDRGLMEIAGEQVAEIGQPMEGDYVQYAKTSHLDYSKIAANAYSLQRIAAMPADSITQTDFLTYLKGSIVNYNHNERELMVSNPAYNYTYIKDRENNWSRRDYKADQYVNNYPTSYRVGDEEWYQVDKESDADNGIFVMSHVVKLDSIGFKELHRVVARGFWQTVSKKLYKTIDIAESIKTINLDPAQGTIAEYSENSNAQSVTRYISQELYRLDIEPTPLYQELFSAITDEQILTLSCDGCTIDTDAENKIDIVYRVMDDYGNILDYENWGYSEITASGITITFDTFDFLTELEANKAYHVSIQAEGEIHLLASGDVVYDEYDCERYIVGDLGHQLSANIESQAENIYQYQVKSLPAEIQYDFGTTTTVLKDYITIPTDSVGIVTLKAVDNKIVLSTRNANGEDESTLIDSIKRGDEAAEILNTPELEFQILNENGEVYYSLPLTMDTDRDNTTTYTDEYGGVTRTITLYQNIHAHILGENKVIVLPAGQYYQRIVSTNISAIKETNFYGAEFDVEYHVVTESGNILDVTAYTNNNLINNTNLPYTKEGDNGETSTANSIDTDVQLSMIPSSTPRYLTFGMDNAGNTNTLTISNGMTATLSLQFQGNTNGLVFDLYAIDKDGNVLKWADDVPGIDPNYGDATLCICDANNNVVWSYQMNGTLVKLKEDSGQVVDWRYRYQMSTEYDNLQKTINVTLPAGTYHTEIRLRNLMVTLDEGYDVTPNFLINMDMSIYASVYAGSATHAYKMLAFTTAPIKQYIEQTIPAHTETVVDTSKTYEAIIGIYVFGSYDGRKWALLGHREKSGNFRDIGTLVERTDCRFFRFVLAGQISKDSRLDYFEVSMRKSKLNGKIR